MALSKEKTNSNIDQKSVHIRGFMPPDFSRIQKSIKIQNKIQKSTKSGKVELESPKKKRKSQAEKSEQIKENQSNSNIDQNSKINQIQISIKNILV